MAIRTEAGEVPETEVAGGAITSESIKLTGIKALVVDDESDYPVARGMRSGGAGRGIGAEAIATLQEHRPDMLIGDIGMPGMDGYQMIRRIRALPADAGGEIPAVALTSYSRMEDRNRAPLAGYQYISQNPWTSRN